ncbi:MAG: ADOP family duplicated permease [Lacunisphaera sp.]
MLFNLRLAFRTLTKTPGLSLVVILSLAIGIGANTVIFSWLKSVVLHPLPGVTAPVLLVETKDDTGNYVSTSWLEYQDLRELLPSFRLLAAHRTRLLQLGAPGHETPVYAELVSANFFAALGLEPQLGRFFHADEATQPGAAPVAVISHDFWRRNFQGAPNIVGRTLILNSRAFTIIGVTPQGYYGGFNSLALDVFVPATMASELVAASTELTARGNRPYVMLAQLRPDATTGQARGELAAAARQLIATHPETNRGLGYEFLPVWRSPRGGVTMLASLVTLQVFAGLILVVVCANTANLLLARASVRQREIGVRLALGAGPSRIVRQLLLESVCLALLGAAAGLIVALWGVDLLAQMPLPGGLPIRLAPALDWTSLVFAAGVATASGLAFGLAPALQLARRDVVAALAGGHGSVGGRSRLRDVLVGLEVAVALVVLVLAGLFLKSFRNALAASPGFDAGRVALAGIDLGGRGYNAKTGGLLLDDLLQRLRALPGVAAAAAANYVPLDLHNIPTGVISVAGKEFDPNRKILYYSVTPGYFATLGIPLLAGTDLAPRARTDLPPDAVIGDEMARRYWPGENPVGRSFEVSGTTYLVAGVARTPKIGRINEAPRPAAWLSMRGQFVSAPILQIRATAGDPRALLPAVRDTIRQLDPELVTLDPRSFVQHIENNLFVERVPAQMLLVLAPLALALAAIGLYAVVAHAVGQRTREIGVRVALGATPACLVALMMWQSLRVVLVGAAAGWIGAGAIAWFLHDRFVGVSFGDPLISGGVPALLLAVATLACWLPARRATKVDPMVALRAE